MSLESQQPELPPSEVSPSEPQEGVSSAIQEKPENFWVETLKTVGISVVLALGMRQFVAEARYIPSGSMEPTLLVDDRLIIDKVSYRFSNPQRGDIVVFDPTPTLKSLNYNEAFIKRVIGLPGDLIEVKEDQVTVNGQPLAENYPSAEHPGTMTKIYVEKYEQIKKVNDEINKRNVERKKRNEINPSKNEPLEELKPQVDLWSAERKGSPKNSPYKSVVPAGQYLVLGDHRSSSLDSRVWGFVSKSEIVGKATLRFWPLNRMGGLDPKPAYAK